MFVKSPNDILDFEWDWSVWMPTGDTIDTVSWTAQSPLVIQNLTPPVSLAAVASTTGGTLAANTYWYKVTTLSPSGETTASNEVSVTTTGSTSSVTLTWDADSTGGISSKIYRGTTSGSENVYQLLSSTAQTFTDIGGTTTAGTVPGSNTAQAISNTANTATVFIGGGTAGNTYTLTCQITTEGGRVSQNTQNVNVVNL